MVNKTASEDQSIPPASFDWQACLDLAKKAGKSMPAHWFDEIQDDPDLSVLSARFQKLCRSTAKSPPISLEQIPALDNLFRDGDWWEIFEAQGDGASPISMLMDEQLAVFQQLWQQVSRQFPLSQLSLIEAMWLALSDKPAAEELSGPIAEYLKLLAKQQGFFLELFRQTLEAKTDTLQQASVGTFRQLMAELVTDFETRYTAQTGLAEYARIYGEMVNTGLVIEKIARRIRAEGQVCTNQTPGDCPDRAGFTNA